MLVPFGYGTATVQIEWLRAWLLEHHHPEYVTRLVAWLEWCEGLVGVGGGWRATQPDRDGFAPDGKSFHQDQAFPGFTGAAAVDVVRLNPTGGAHRTVAWSDVPKQGTAEATTWGVHANVDQGTYPEAWHIQPVELDGWQSWVNRGRPDLRANYPFPGRTGQPSTPPPPSPIPTTDPAPTGGRLMIPSVLRYGGKPDEGWSGYYTLDLINRLPIRTMHQASILVAGGCIDAKTGRRVTSPSLADVTHTTKLDDLNAWLTPGKG